MATVSNQIQEIYVGLLGRAADKSGLDYWTAEIDAGTLTVEQLRANIVTEQTEYAEGLGSLTRAQTVSELYARLFERSADAEGLEYWVNGAGASVNVDQLVVALSEGASASDRLVLDNKTEAATYYTNNAATYDSVKAMSAVDSVDSTSASVAASKAATLSDTSAGGTSFELTAGTDKGTDFVGTSAADTFIADLSQNPFAGGVSNTLSSADKLDGQAGVDTLSAVVVNEFVGATAGYNIDVQPNTTKIENVEFEARDLINGLGGANTAVTVDAKNMIDVEKIGSKFSDGDLIIENLTTQSSAGGARSTDSITVTMDHTDNFNSDNDASDLTVYFDEDYLLKTTTLGESSVVFKIMNQDSYDQNNGEMRLDGVYVARMEFELDGQRYDLAPFIEEDAAALGNEFQTEVALVEYLNATALPALIAANPEAAEALASLTFSIGNKWNDENQNRIGDEIVLSASNAYTLETRDAWLTIDQAEAVETGYASNRIERTGEYTGTDSSVLAVNVELHKAGREGEGGNLIIGGKELDQDGGRDSEGNGIDVFNISVLGAADKLSNVGSISSTNDELDIVNIKTDDAYVNGETFASLTIRDGFGFDTVAGTVTPEALTLVDADQFKGDLTIGSDTKVLNLATLNASGGGDVAFYADVNVDGNYDYNTGSGNDTIDLDISTDAIDRVNTGLDVNTANGNDTVTLNTVVQHASQQTMALADNMDIATGSGADTMEVTGDGRFNIDAGSDSDFVYINSQVNMLDNTTGHGNNGTEGTEGTWTFGRESDSAAVDFPSTVLYSATLTVVFAGLESTVTVDTVLSKIGRAHV